MNKIDERVSEVSSSSLGSAGSGAGGPTLVMQKAGKMLEKKQKNKLQFQEQQTNQALEAPQAFSESEGSSVSETSDDSDSTGGEPGREEAGGPPFPKVTKLFVADGNPDDKLVGVVVTIHTGSSFDKMFKEVQPTTVPGERVSTFSISCLAVRHLRERLVEIPAASASSSSAPPPTSEAADANEQLWALLVREVHQVPADSVVFNWECCSGCGEKAFPASVPRRFGVPSLCVASRSRASPQRRGADSSDERGPSETMKFMGFAVRSGFTVMCSDFSLKSLIHEWSEEELGPCPFVKVGGCDGQFAIDFIPIDLTHEDVPQQLQVVGELCSEQGRAVIRAMSDTIVYTVDPARRSTCLYDLKVLTVVSDFSNFSPRGRMADADSMKCSVGEGVRKKIGWAGHVILSYIAGGQIVTSMGHWIELTRIDTTLDSIVKAAQKNFGAEEVKRFQREYDAMTTDAERRNCIQAKSREMVSKSVPTRMAARSKYA